jgi:RimJ/RimL family protein N-acetyltransferase
VDVREVTLRGRHVVLEPLRPEHVDQLWPAGGEPEIWRYTNVVIRSKEELAGWIADRRAGIPKLEALPFLQRDANTGQAFGSTSLFDIDRHHRRMEVGHTWITASHRRTAANTEAKLLLLTHAFDRLGAYRVQFKTGHMNERSQKAIERLGATKEGVLRNHMVQPDGSHRHSMMYSITPSEWSEVRARLQGFLDKPR